MIIVRWFLSIPWQGQVLTVCFVIVVGISIYWGIDAIRRLRAMPPEE